MKNALLGSKALVTLLLTLIAVAHASEVDVLIGYFPLNGSAGDASGQGIYGQLIGEGGVAADESPEYAEGKFDRAIRLNGINALRIPLDLDPARYPQLTVTAWLYLEDVGEECDAIVSTGDGGGPALMRCGRGLELRAGEETLRVDNALGPSQWHFIAGVWDYDSGKAYLYWRTRFVDKEIVDDDSVTSEPDLWVGAYNDTLKDKAEGVRVDELRIFATALDADEISILRDSPSVQSQPAPAESETESESRPSVVTIPRVPTHDILAKRPFNLGSSSETETAEENNTDEPEPETNAPLVLTPVIKPTTFKVRSVVIGEERKLSSRAGNRGDIIKEVDFTTRTIDSLHWSEKRDKPCEVAVSDSDEKLGMKLRVIYQCDGGSGTFGCENLPCTGELATGYAAESAVRLDPNQAITGVRLCMNSSGERVKGIEIWGAEILKTGTLSVHTAKDLERLPNCRDKNWTPLVTCSGAHAATGIRAHFRKGRGLSSNTDALTGLELVCRSVSLQE